jgi:hypothetical protein
LHLQVDSLVLANLRARLESNFRGWIMGDDDKRQVTEIAGGADLRGTDICKSVVFLERGPKAAATILRMKFTAAQPASDAKGGRPYQAWRIMKSSRSLFVAADSRAF